ncbi:MAG: hypothetical protein WCG83_00095 [Candidatus Peregrinibacteria bacterium]
MADPTPPTPPRPGDPVPAGGLDPTQVFGTPPPPPPQAGAAGAAGAKPVAGAAGAQDDGAIPQDMGPPPPPVGTIATKEMGFDDEDIRILGEIGNYRFGSITVSLTNDNIIVPAHTETKMDEQLFLTLLRGSISLTRDEKWRIIQAIPKLSQFQIDELQKILEEEKKKFSELSPKHLLQLQKLEQKHAADWTDLQAVTVQTAAKSDEAAKAEEIRKQLGL